MDKNLKFYLGIILLVCSFIVPLLGFWVASLPLPLAVKGTIIGILTVGGPEVLAIIAVALLGKEAFEVFKSKALGVLSKLAPQGSVSKTQYQIGLALFVFSFIPSWIFAYVPQLAPEVARITITASADLLFIVSLFVLGGDFWDKLKSLFVFDARAHFPSDA